MVNPTSYRLTLSAPTLFAEMRLPEDVMITVLVIGENDSGKIKLGRRLERNGYAVRFRQWESDWQQAIDRTDPDVVLIRVVSKGGDIAELIRRVKTDASKMNIPVVTLKVATGKPINYPKLFCTLEAVATGRP